jgi:hypothetical protein
MFFWLTALLIQIIDVLIHVLCRQCDAIRLDLGSAPLSTQSHRYPTIPTGHRGQALFASAAPGVRGPAAPVCVSPRHGARDAANRRRPGLPVPHRVHRHRQLRRLDELANIVWRFERSSSAESVIGRCWPKVCCHQMAIFDGADESLHHGALLRRSTPSGTQRRPRREKRRAATVLVGPEVAQRSASYSGVHATCRARHLSSAAGRAPCGPPAGS